MRRVQLTALAMLVGALILPPSAHGTASFTFVPDQTQPSLPPGSRLVAVADLAGNGIPDLVIENAQADTLGVMLGNGAGGFGPPSSIGLGARPTGALVAGSGDDSGGRVTT